MLPLIGNERTCSPAVGEELVEEGTQEEELLRKTHLHVT